MNSMIITGACEHAALRVKACFGRAERLRLTGFGQHNGETFCGRYEATSAYHSVATAHGDAPAPDSLNIRLRFARILALVPNFKLTVSTRQLAVEPNDSVPPGRTTNKGDRFPCRGLTKPYTSKRP